MGEKATFAMGCFWGPQEFFSKLKGVTNTRVGYTGGEKKNPSYWLLGNHTEAIEITFDDKIISYKYLLKKFWRQHDATQKNKTQYQSMILYHNQKQKKEAQKSKEEEEKMLGSKVTTKIIAATTFYQAEDFHQHYLKKMKKGKSFLKKIFS
jgi:peptide-methionine (S)-S-oxide reductase